MYIYIYIYTYTYVHIARILIMCIDVSIYYNLLSSLYCIVIIMITPSPPTKSCPTKSPRVKLSGRFPIKFNRHENSHPLELRVCLSQTLRNPNSW